MHAGHLAILRHLLSSGFDAVRMIVSPESPFKEVGEATSQIRLEAVRRKVAQLVPEVIVDDVEFRLPRPNYTVNTLRALQKANPGTRFTVVMGADNFAGIEKWRSWQEILSGYDICVYPRKGFDARSKCLSLGVRYIDVPEVDISSTEIRRGTADKNMMI